MVLLMVMRPGLETVPYHLLFLMLTIVYGFRVWPVLPTAVVIALVTLVTGGILYLHYRQGHIDRPELTEVVLMPALLLAMVWHARRRMAAQRALQQMTERQQAMIEREHDFFRDTAHAIRTPVTIARGHLELSEPAISSPQAREDVQVALRQLERMSVLSNRLLAIAQLDAGTPFPVGAVVVARPRRGDGRQLGQPHQPPLDRPVSRRCRRPGDSGHARPRPGRGHRERRPLHRRGGRDRPGRGGHRPRSAGSASPTTDRGWPPRTWTGSSTASGTVGRRTARWAAAWAWPWRPPPRVRAAGP